MAYFKCPKTSSGGGGDTAIYGAEWAGTSDPAWTRTDDAVGLADPNPYYVGMTGDPSSPFDNIMPWSGMEAVEDTEAGTLVKIPKFYYKWTRNDPAMKLQISMTKHEGFLCSPAHADRGDGAGERDYVYVGKYHCAASTYKSSSGVLPQASQTRAAFRSAISALGTSIWQWDYAMLWTIRMLYLIEFAHWNSQLKIGYGCGNNSAAENNGLTDTFAYHTGTNTSSRSAYGHVKYRHIEGLWDNVRDFVDGIVFSSTNVLCIKNPAEFSDTTGGVTVGTRWTGSSGNDIKSWTNPSANGFEYALYPASIGSDSAYATYVCDRVYGSSPSVVLNVGGSYGQSQYCGLFYSCGNSVSYSNAYVGSRLQKLP